MKKIFLLLALLSGNAYAGVLFEPYAGYLSGNYKQSLVINGASLPLNNDFTGYGAGARLGITTGYFALGGEVMKSKIKLKNGGGEVEPLDYGAFAGVFVPGSFRLYGGYTLSSKADFGADKLKGTGYKAGVGYEFASHLSINAEYVVEKFDTFDLAGGLGLGGTLTYSGEAKGYMVTVGFPFGM